jgi:hypothetical protein
MKSYRERESVGESGLTESDLLCKNSRIYTRGLYTKVYRGDFRKPENACEFTHVSVFMRTRRADNHFAALRIMSQFPLGSERDRSHDLGSLQKKTGISLVVILELFNHGQREFKF